jgi:hypothetical protein
MTNHDATKKRLAEERQNRDKKQAEQRATMEGVKPTPLQAENDAFATAVAHNTLPPKHQFAWDGSPVDPQSPDPTPPTPTWP